MTGLNMPVRQSAKCSRPSLRNSAAELKPNSDSVHDFISPNLILTSFCTYILHFTGFFFTDIGLPMIFPRVHFFLEKKLTTFFSRRRQNTG